MLLPQMSEMSREKIIALHNRGQRQEAIEKKGRRVIDNLLNLWPRGVPFDHLLNETESSYRWKTRIARIAVRCQKLMMNSLISSLLIEFVKCESQNVYEWQISFFLLRTKLDKERAARCITELVRWHKIYILVLIYLMDLMTEL